MAKFLPMEVRGKRRRADSIRLRGGRGGKSGLEKNGGDSFKTEWCVVRTEWFIGKKGGKQI